MRKFYYEYNQVEDTWDVYEADVSFDEEFMFCCSTEDDAIDAVDLLHELQEQ